MRNILLAAVIVCAIATAASAEELASSEFGTDLGGVYDPCFTPDQEIPAGVPPEARYEHREKGEMFVCLKMSVLIGTPFEQMLEQIFYLPEPSLPEE